MMITIDENELRDKIADSAWLKLPLIERFNYAVIPSIISLFIGFIIGINI